MFYKNTTFTQKETNNIQELNEGNQKSQNPIKKNPSYLEP